MDYSRLLEEVKQYVIHFVTSNFNNDVVYHDLEHTGDVVKAASKLGNHYKLNDQDLFIILSASWFHDAGYFNGSAMDHETRSAKLASGFLEEKGVNEVVIQAVSDCILATRIPQSPANLLQQIVCDADLSHLGSENFSKRNKLLRKETEIRESRSISGEEWRKGSIRFLEQHTYHTDFSHSIFDETKNQNLLKLKHKEEEKKQENASQSSPVISQDANAPAETPKKNKTDRPERGIETMFRISSNNHQRLSDMADNKAHIMITTTSIIISVLLSVLLRKLEDNPYLIFPTTLLLAVCVITLVFCILATRPSLPAGTFTKKDIENKNVNLLFFGNFYRMNFDEYSYGMKEMMNDREFLYGSLTRDLYSQGIVLGHKYRLLRKGYNIFMFGIVASVVAFIIASVFFGS